MPIVNTTAMMKDISSQIEDLTKTLNAVRTLQNTAKKYGFTVVANEHLKLINDQIELQLAGAVLTISIPLK